MNLAPPADLPAGTRPGRAGRPTAADSREKIAGILVAARELFCARGFRTVTMRQVAEAAQVSTRTLYNHYADKLALFTACLDFGAASFPQIHFCQHEDVAQVLAAWSVAVVELLSSDAAQQLGMLVYREGVEIPELVIAAEANQDQHMVQPLARYLAAAGLAGAEPAERAKLFIAMAISEWQRSASFRRPPPPRDAIERHAAHVVRLFLHGARGDHHGQPAGIRR